ncbi:glycerophosphodiester phosphodiesterase family protein [Fodinicola feengrottensis]|uniref:glycerophosphodiester phosphodiesterase n=1 Tax=Fodinicola feengrottensis TaxID=435914 RepID=A0ABP4SNU6_9ACTN|nr:glycerophosphodiester phosphodiesterase family protein [Fodinicola feengrottensis]
MPLVIGHRGSCGYRPENTLISFALAVELGADFVEMDVVPSADGVLVVRHDADLSDSTDVAARPEFAERRRTATIDGADVDGWFADDFTVAEIRTLRAVERHPDLRRHSARYDGQPVPTFAETLTWLAQLATEAGRPIGVYVEPKHPTYYRSIGKPVEDLLVKDLAAAGRDRADSPTFVQSFEIDPLHRVASMTEVRRVQLMGSGHGPYDRTAAGDPLLYSEMTTPSGLRRIAEYAVGIGPNKEMVLATDRTGQLAGLTGLVPAAHEAGLFVHPYTFRDENKYLAEPYRRGTDPSARGDGAAECEAFLRAGVDGLFTDFVDSAMAARAAWLRPERVLTSV